MSSGKADSNIKSFIRQEGFNEAGADELRKRLDTYFRMPTMSISFNEAGADELRKRTPITEEEAEAILLQ